MFGGHGLYRDGTFFGILFRGRLYLKTDAQGLPRYRAHGMGPFRPNARQTLRSYYEVPPDILGDPESLVDWAREALRAQVFPGPRRRRAGARSRRG